MKRIKKIDDINNGSNINKKISNRRPRGLVIAVVVLAMVLSVVSLVALNVYGVSVYYRNQLENQYQRSFYDLASNMGNLEIKLSKLMISNSDSQIQKNLNDVSRQTDNTQINLSQLPTTHDTIYKTMRFVNQLGDYSSYLSNKIAAGGKLEEDNYTTIESLYNVNKELSKELVSMVSKIGTEIKLVYTKNGDTQGNPLAKSLGNMQETSIDYPTIIYDGPFSDSEQTVKVKGLTGGEITKEQAEVKLNEYFKSFSIAEVLFENETDGNIATYNFNVTLASKQKMYIQISKIGGMPVLIDNNRTIDNYSLDVKECITKAEEFAKVLGYDNLKSVWASDYKGSVYVNVTPVVNDVIYYPDLIKIIVARDNGDILGLETTSYLTNHIARSVGSPAITMIEARRNISTRINIISDKLALIPVSSNKETLAYEFAGEWNDLKYFIYIDAATGDEIEIFRVIDSDEGTFII